LVRFAFCKRDDTMEEAIRRLGALRGERSDGGTLSAS
jgi:N-succinyldiaminopimelate aminotransferase